MAKPKKYVHMDGSDSVEDSLEKSMKGGDNLGPGAQPCNRRKIIIIIILDYFRYPSGTITYPTLRKGSNHRLKSALVGDM